MIRCVHTADVHYGVENYGRVDPETGIHSRLLDFHRAFNQAIDYAIAERVDIFLFAGDAYKTAHPTPTQQRLFIDSLLKLYRAKIPVVIVVGNHDNALSFGKAHALEIFEQLPLDGFHVIAKPACITIETRQGPCAIVGIPWPSRATVALQGARAYQNSTQVAEYLSAAITDIIEHLASDIAPETPAILVGHLTVASGVFSGSEKRAIYGSDPVFTVSSLARAPFDYVALGHLHRYQNLNPHGYPAIVYAGSIERVDFGERRDEKGFCVVTIAEKGRATHTFVPVTTRPCLQIDVKLGAAAEQHTEDIITAISAHIVAKAIVKITYRLPAGVRDGVDIATVQQACAKAHYIAGIIPIREAAPHQAHKRSYIAPATHDLESLLTIYIASRPELAPLRTQLIAAAHRLQESQEQQSSEE